MKFEKEAKEYSLKYSNNLVDSDDIGMLAIAYQDGAKSGYMQGKEEREKRIEELEKENTRMKKDGDDLSKRFDYQVKRVMELEKANEWHYPSKGEYPEEYEDIFICFNNDDIEDYVRGWYEYDSVNNIHIFKYVDMLGTHYITFVYAWKYFTYPKIHEEADK